MTTISNSWFSLYNQILNAFLRGQCFSSCNQKFAPFLMESVERVDCTVSVYNTTGGNWPLTLISFSATAYNYAGVDKIPLFFSSYSIWESSVLHEFCYFLFSVSCGLFCGGGGLKSCMVRIVLCGFFGSRIYNWITLLWVSGSQTASCSSPETHGNQSGMESLQKKTSSP